VAGLHKRPVEPPVDQSVDPFVDPTAAPEVEAPAVDDAPDTAAEPTPVKRRKRAKAKPPIDSAADTDTDTDTDVDADAGTDADGESTGPRPVGRAGRVRRSDPSPAPKAAASKTAIPSAKRSTNPLLLPLVLVLVAAVLAGLGFWFQSRGGDIHYNEALVNTGGTTEVDGQAREAVEKAFSYNFADVTATEKVANELLVGKAKCQYNAIFGPVRTLAPEQKLVVTVKVVSSGVTSLEGDRATVLLFLDQITTRTTDNQSGGGVAMMRVSTQRLDGRWKVDNMEMFGQTGDQSAEMQKCADAK
jgi:Mce-associated membrane protein